MIVVEPDTSNEEIIFLWGFTPGGTTGLVQRVAEVSTGGTAVGIAHAAVPWSHGPTNADFYEANPALTVFLRQNYR